jgi:hypothetical protein
VALYQGPPLPASTAPGIVELRRELEAELHGAVLATCDPEVLWALAQAMPYDLELWEALEEQLPQDDPRRSVAAGRGARVRQELDL